MSSTTSRRIQPDRSAPCVDDDDLVDLRLELRQRVLDRLDRPGLDDEALRGESASRSAFSVRSSRRPAEARRVSS